MKWLWILPGLALAAMLLPPEVQTELELHPGMPEGGLRMISAQLLHYSWRHWLWDSAALLAAGWIVARRRAAVLPGFLLAGLLASGLAAEYGCRDFAAYRGLSGVAAALFVQAALLAGADRPWLGWAALLGFGVKVLWESVGGAACFGGAGFEPTGIVHLAGGAIGVLSGIRWRRPNGPGELPALLRGRLFPGTML